MAPKWLLKIKLCELDGKGGKGFVAYGLGIFVVVLIQPFTCTSLLDMRDRMYFMILIMNTFKFTSRT